VVGTLSHQALQSGTIKRELHLGAVAQRQTPGSVEQSYGGMQNASPLEEKSKSPILGI